MSRQRALTPKVVFTQAQVDRRTQSLNAAKQRRLATMSRNRLSGITAQTIRVGGWANPAKTGELKFKDRGFSNNVPSAVDGFDVIGDDNLMNGIGGGSKATQRVGRKVTMKSLLLRYSFYLNPAATTPATGGSPLRIIVFYDKQANASHPTITDLVVSNLFNANNNLDNRDRFVVLADIYTDPISSVGSTSVAGKRYIRLNNEVVFNDGDTENSIGTITTGSVYIVWAQTGGIKSDVADGIKFKWNARIRYEDL